MITYRGSDLNRLPRCAVATGGCPAAVANRGAAGHAHRVRQPAVEGPAMVASCARNGAAERRRPGSIPA